MTHLTRDEVLALAQAERTPDGHHGATCASCRDEVLALRSVIEVAKGVDVPEPSPLFWDHLSARVRLAIDAQPAATATVAGPAPSWRWRFLCGGLSAAVVAGLLVLGRAPASPIAATPVSEAASVPASPPHGPTGADEESGIDFELVADAAGNLAVGDAGEVLDAGAPGAAEALLSGLSDEEEQELARLLRAEMEKGRPS